MEQFISMKITNKQYAQSLYEVVSTAEDGDVQVVMKNFVKVLIEKNKLGKAEKIIQEFEKIWNREQGIIEGELTSARELGDEIIVLLNCYIVKLLGVDKVKLENKIDKNILGGFVARLGDTVIDSSLKSQLQSLKSKLVN
ncbi:MAG: ATP synthase F1 subunit delta [Candidatus Falkowbacteria bacterium]